MCLLLPPQRFCNGELAGGTNCKQLTTYKDGYEKKKKKIQGRITKTHELIGRFAYLNLGVAKKSVHVGIRG